MYYQGVTRQQKTPIQSILMDHPVDYEISDEVHWYWFNMDWVGALKAWLKIKKDELEYIKENLRGH